ncbi:MAG TPA: hypothetical protein VLE73_07005 [Candidatus Saccharimonadales bacterium]|nr:hypothetical protein [Candidatus Saccharimonadales bacterium]
MTILSNLTKADQQRWQEQFVKPKRNYLESIWRRSQDAVPDASDPDGRRRRMIHVIDRYDVVPTPGKPGSYDFCITECYMWLCSTLPKTEVSRYQKRLEKVLLDANWTHSSGLQWKRGELSFTMAIVDQHPEDTAAGRDFGADYQTIECTLISKGFPQKRIQHESPWAVFNSGVRTPGSRVPDPTIVKDMAKLLEYLPAQVELGGGASMELGIPPLNYLHTVYGLYTPEETFAYGDTDVLLDKLLADPEHFYTKEASVPYARALMAEPNDFYRLLAELYTDGLVVGPVITNNFDGFCSRIGLQELFVRRYDESHIVPDITFHPKARSLLVVGSHADRRRVQQAAKLQGLKVIYVDPESYVNHDGDTIPYPLEKIEADDLLVRMSSSDFARQLRATLATSSNT